jgi:DeoR/GlpR family transcriptional regulator of sugar metabolism
MTTFADQRRFQIMALLDSQPRVSSRDLSAQLGVSESSVRRDLEILEELGLLKRVKDGAVAMPRYRLGKDHSVKMNLNREKKECIGRVAASLIQPGESVIIDSGTTPLQVAHSICSDLRLSGDLTVYTTSLPIVREIGGCPGIRLMLLGGIYMPANEALAGPQTIDNLQDVQADKLFLGADGITLSHGVTTAGVLEADVDRYMLQASKEVIVVADSSKIGIIGLVSLIQLEHINKLVTDPDAPPAFVEALRNLGVDVILACFNATGDH